MKYYIAPLEGVTGHVFRTTHHKYFPFGDKYYMPFIAPTKHHEFSTKERLELSPENNKGVVSIPQILTKSSGDFIWAMNEMIQLGYKEINLNVGCPSPTVVCKGKGSGLLKDLEHFERFLDEIFNANSQVISIKTRIGIENVDEFYKIIELYNQYPIKELTIHPRLQQDFYNKKIKMDTFTEALPLCKSPVCYNGDILRKEDVVHLEKTFPQLNAVMMGRGIMKNPALISNIYGKDNLDKKILKDFHDELFYKYTILFQSQNNAMMRMKQLWGDMIFLFETPNKLIKKINKCKDGKKYMPIIEEMFNNFEVIKQK